MTLLAAPAGALRAQGYVPDTAWARVAPAAAGMDSAALAVAVAHAAAHEIPWQRDMAAQTPLLYPGEPHPGLLGPTRDRGGQNGLILRGGRIVAEWGETRRVDMTFSVAKSYLAAVAGLAADAGLLPSVDEPVARRVDDGGFTGAQNAPITWRMLLTQTSEWEGTLWDKPDVADRRAGYDRALRPAGTFWEYNDVRVNRLALALLRVWQQPLPEVLRARLMDPIGASDGWEWHGYRNSRVRVAGRDVESVSGGSHWGGGFWASTRDHARFGLLIQRRGRWGNRQLLSAAWIAQMLSPTPLKPTYGFLWWLNTDRRQYPAAPATSAFALGAGGNMIWVDPALDLVVVVRWLDPKATPAFIGLVMAALGAPPAGS